MIKETIEFSLEYKKAHGKSIVGILKDEGVSIIEDEIGDIVSYTIKIRDKNIIVIDENLDEIEYNFVLCHEFYHILKHDEVNRCFSNIIGTDRFEIEANIFATIFLNLENFMDNNTRINRTINSTISVIKNAVI